MSNNEPKHISEFIMKWQKSLPQTMRSEFEYDTYALINQKQPQPQPSDKVQISKHTLVEVNRAFRALKQDRNSYIHKVFSDDGVFDAMEEIRNMFEAIFVEKSTEQVTEPTEQPAQPSSQVKLDNSFDRERFERMFRAVVASGQWENCEIAHTEFLINKLDAYYASKEGGNNG